MEYNQTEVAEEIFGENGLVLILVLMEYNQTLGCDGALEKTVLILVLMEYNQTEIY